MSMMKVYPAKGRLVRHPWTGDPVPATGLTVPCSPYWMRRLRDGDLTTARPAETSPDREGAKENA